MLLCLAGLAVPREQYVVKDAGLGAGGDDLRRNTELFCDILLGQNHWLKLHDLAVTRSL